MSVIGSNILAGASGQATGYNVERSLRFNSSDSAYLSRTPSTAGNRKTWTWAGWVKRSELGTSQGLFSSVNSATQQRFQFISDKLYWAWAQGTSFVSTNAVFRDVSAWYHIVIASDTDNSTAADRIKIYVNNVRQTVSGSTVNPGEQWDINTTIQHRIGVFYDGGSTNQYFSGYLADIHFIDGQALTPSSFTEVSATTGQLIPKAYTGTFGTNGFWLKFSDNSNNTAATLGKDYSPNGNNWTPNNLSVTAGAGNDSLVDTPTSYGTDTGAGGEVRGNYCTWNPLDKGASVTLTNGNLDVSTASTWNSTRATFGLTSGKWYWEYTMTAAGYTMVGIGTSVINLAGYIGQSSAGYAFYSLNGNKWNAGSAASYGSSFTTNDVIGVAFDVDAGKVWFSKNGTWQASGDPAAGTNAAYSSIPAGNYFPTVSQDNTVGATGGVLNAGARPFAYTAPSGFEALCDTSLPAPVVAKGSAAMDVKLYTGNGSTQTISGLNFSPDLVWIKSRSSATWWNQLFDTVRGAGNYLASNSTGAEGGGGTSLVPSFTSDGFNLNMVPNGTVNNNGDTYVAWTWDAGTTTSSNVAGSITSQVRANVSAGFSVATWTGTGSGSATVGHGLGVAPRMMIVKDRSNARNWLVYHTTLGATSGAALNSTSAASGADAGWWNNTSPTSTVATIGTYGNESANYVGYFWTPVAGYSSFGSYTGNGSADGPFVYTGFRPRWVMVKLSSAAGDNWVIMDAARSDANLADDILWANLSNAELGNYGNGFDFTANGFKIRGTWNGNNSSAATYIYAAFAESPFQYARAR